jgi:hypothetical protein
MLFQTASSTLWNRSTGLLDCYTNGRFDSTKWLKQKQHVHDEFIDVLKLQNNKSNDPPTQHERKKRHKRIILARRSENDELEEIPPTESMWYNLYITCPQVHDERFQKKFRRRFRIPYNSFIEFVEDAKDNEWFPRWQSTDCTGHGSSPLELLILGAFRYLGRGFTFDDIEEATGISEEVHRVFFHRFIWVGSTILFDKYVITPTDMDEAKTHMHEFFAAGMAGACASSDATHVIHENCAWRLRRTHKGFKSKYCTRTYNMTVNHRRRILGSTRGHPGSWNDKTVVLFDTFIRGIKRGDILNDNIFELYEMQDGEVLRVKYRGVWLLVDNGYHAWANTVPPFSNTAFRDEIRWSEWVESMRKDVECAFGIMKGRWRILKTGIRLHTVQSVDMIWATCCAFHNMLLEVDGLDEPWNGLRVPTSQWEGHLGGLDDEDVPLAMRRLLSPGALRAYDTSSIGTRQNFSLDEGENTDVVNMEGNDGGGLVREVRLLSLAFFRSKLVEHFNIAWKRNEVVWPTRRGTAPLFSC